MNRIRVELKVCEACGALWLRAFAQGAYCSGCAHWLSEFPMPTRSRRGRKRSAARTAVCAGGAR